MSHLLCDLGLSLQGERHEFMSDTVPLLAVYGAVLQAQTRDDNAACHIAKDSSKLWETSAHLSFHLQLLQLPLVGPLAECLVDLGHNRDLFAAVINNHRALGLRKVPHEP